MTDSPLSRRHFFGATAAVAVGTQFQATTTAAESKPSALAPEPLLPAGVCQRLGSARFRELTKEFRFSPDSKWLAEFDGTRFLGYEVATGRRVMWALSEDDRKRGFAFWQLANAAVFVRYGDDLDTNPPSLYDRETGHRRPLHTFTQNAHCYVTPDGTALIQSLGEQLWRTDLATGKKVWQRKWKSDDLVPAEPFTVTDRWLVGFGVQRLHLFDPATGKDGPKLEEAEPKDAPQETHFLPLNFSADGTRLAARHTAEVPGRIVVWDLTSGKVAARCSLPEAEAAQLYSGLVLSPDGAHLLTTSADYRLVGVDVRTGRVTRRLPPHGVGDILLSPDGKVLVAEKLQPNNFGGFGPIGGGLFVEPPTIVRLLDPATGALLPQSPDPPSLLAGVRFGDPHTVVAEWASSCAAPAWVVWDRRTGVRRVVPRGATLLGPLSPSDNLSPDGSLTLDYDLLTGRVRVADAFSRRRLHEFAFPTVGTTLVPFWVGRRTVAQAESAALHLYDLNSRVARKVPLKLGDVGDLSDAAASPDGRTVLVTFSRTTDPVGTVAWVDLTSGRVTTTPVQAAGQLMMSVNGDRVGAQRSDGPNQDDRARVVVFGRDGWRGSVSTRTASSASDRRAGLSACGRTVFLAHTRPGEADEGNQPVIQFWEVVSGELRAEFATAYKADGLGVSPCGRRIATTHRDAPIYLWDVFGEKSDPQPKPDKAAWDALNGPTDKAFTAVRQLVQHPATAVELLAEKLKPAEAPKPEWVKARIGNLSNPDFRTRHKAELELSAVADVIAEPLRAAFDAGVDTQEAHERLERLVQRAAGVPASAIRTVRAVEALEYCDVPSAGELLKKLTGGVESAVLTREAKAAVKRRGERPA